MTAYYILAQLFQEFLRKAYFWLHINLKNEVFMSVPSLHAIFATKQWMSSYILPAGQKKIAESIEQTVLVS